MSKNIDPHMMAIRKWGIDHQVMVAIEELAELQLALCRGARKRGSNIPEEIADVRIMLRQLELIYDCASEVEKYQAIKLERLERMAQQ